MWVLIHEEKAFGIHYPCPNLPECVVILDIL